MEYKSTKINSLQRIKSSGIPINAIVDIGVERQTAELISAFPELVHHLFEPVALFYPEIRRNYESVAHVLHEMALSNKTTTLFCVVTALRKDGMPTHARLTPDPVKVDGQVIVSCTEVDVVRFDIPVAIAATAAIALSSSRDDRQGQV